MLKVIYNSRIYGVRCKGIVSYESPNLYTVDILEIEIDNIWINFDKFKNILIKFLPETEDLNYEVVEKCSVKPFE